MHAGSTVRGVKMVQFGVLSPEEIKHRSVTKPDGICYPYVMMEGKPMIGGLMDPRQGAVDKRSKCQTCAGSIATCPGHFGHIDLAEPIFHVGYLNKVLKILRCVCFYCSRLLIDPNDKEVKEKAKRSLGSQFKFVYTLASKKSVCKGGSAAGVLCDSSDNRLEISGGCGCLQPKIYKCGLELVAEWLDSEEEKMVVTAKQVLGIFKQISDEDCAVLGLNPKFCRPEWMILTVFPVPPLTLRPALMMHDSWRSQDSLTRRLACIVEANQRLIGAKKKQAPYTIMKYTNQLKFFVAAMIDCRLSVLPKKSGGLLNSRLKSIKQRVNARVRENLMGKKVDFSARTVITPDPNLDIDQVGVPMAIAQNLTFPEIVTTFNKDRLTELVNGRHCQYPGARYIILENGERVDLRYHAKPSDLQLGHKVERYLMDDDLVVLSHQPALNKMSMMGHRVKILPWSTFRLNPSVLTLYNANCDGDEMNLHVPQNLEAKAEVQELLMVPKNILSTESNCPVLGIVQDSLTAATKMTRRDVFIEKEEMMKLLMWIPSWDGKVPHPAIIKPKPLWTGKQLFSVIIPDNANLHFTHPSDEDYGSYKFISPGDSKVIIEDGVLLAGALSKSTLDSKTGSLVHIIASECDHDVIDEFYSSLQMVVNNFLLIEGLSLGIADAITDTNTYNSVKGIIAQAKDDVGEVIRRGCHGEMETTPGSTLSQTLELQVTRLLLAAHDQCGFNVQKSLSELNNVKVMMTAGSHGSKDTVTQIIACVGQQTLEEVGVPFGKRISCGFQHRSLPHFVKHDLGPGSRGFVESSFLLGLTPSEFYFHAIEGRDKLASSVLKTSRKGFTQHLLVKAMEDLMVHYDGTVRDSNKRLVQLRYGEDGMKGERMKIRQLSCVHLLDQKFEQSYKFDYSNSRDLLMYFTKEIVDDIEASTTVLSELEKEWQQIVEDRKKARSFICRGNLKVTVPINLDRLIWKSRKLYKVAHSLTDLHPLKVVRELRELTRKLVAMRGEDPLSKEAHWNTALLFTIMLPALLCSKQVEEEHPLSSAAFDQVIREIETHFQQSQVQPGEMVGVLAAQSLGEPVDEMILKYLYYSGVSAKKVTRGIPRLKEIINLSKRPKTPSLTVFLRDQAAKDAEKCKDVLNRIEYATLQMLTIRVAIYYDPDPLNTVVTEDQEFVTLYYEMPDFEISQFSPWLLRLELNRDKMLDKKITMEKIAERIFGHFGKDLLCICNDSSWVLRIRVLCSQASKEEQVRNAEDSDFLHSIWAKLADMAIQGIEGITKVYMHYPTQDSKKYTTITSDGELKFCQNWILETEGVNLIKVLNEPCVDPVRTVSNSIVEIFTVLGIEAARGAIVKELREVFFSYENYHHLALLSDLMCWSGQLLSITKHRISGQDMGPLKRASVKNTVDCLTEASVHAEKDTLQDVSANTMLGQLPIAGTGAFDLRLGWREDVLDSPY